MESKQAPEQRFALLIDADNVSAKYLKPILNELSKYGTVTIKRIYGDWTLTLHAKWKDTLLENSITPIQQFGYTQGKNATDSAMIIDAMDILYTDKVDGFCIVSSDSDFTRLAARLRESGRMVIGMGEKKTPTPFRRACDVFTTLELLEGGHGSNGKSRSKADQAGQSSGAAASLSREELEQAVCNIITENLNNGKSTGLGEVGSRLLKRYPDFDVRSYGTNLLSKLLNSFESVKVIKDGSSVAVELTDDKDRDAANHKSNVDADGSAADASTSGVETRPAASGAAVETSEAAQDAASDVSAEAHAEEVAGAPEEGKAVSSTAADEASDQAEGASKSRRPRSRRRRPRHTLTKDVRAVEPTDSPDAEKPKEEKIEESPSEKPPTEEPETQLEVQPKPKVEKAPNEEPASDKPEVEPEAQPQPKAKPKPKVKPQPKPKPKPKPQSKPKLQAKPQAKPKVEPKAKATAAAKAASPVAAQDVEAYIRALLVEAGTDGISVTDLNRRVRAKFRSFKVRDFGYSQFKGYAASISGITVERKEGGLQAYAKH